MDVRYTVGRNEYRRMTTEELRAALDEAELACGGIRDFLPHRECGCGKRKGIWCPLWKFWQKYVRGGSGRRG